MSRTLTWRILITRNDIIQPTQRTSKIELAMDMLVVGNEGTMHMMNGESPMSSVREKKQEGEKEKKREKRNFVLSSHTVYGRD